MRKELGKFFIDVAKLIIAGVLLATIIHDVTNRWLIYTLGSTSVFTLLINSSNVKLVLKPGIESSLSIVP